jgi:hypothetical protein
MGLYLFSYPQDRQSPIGVRDDPSNINHGAPLSPDAGAYRTSFHHVQQEPEVLSPVQKRSIANVCPEASPLAKVSIEIIQNEKLTQTTSPRVITSFKNFTNTADPLLDGTCLPHGGGIKTDRRGAYLLDTLSKNGIVPIRVNKKYTFYKNGRTTFLDIISTNKGLARKYKESKIPNMLLASYHTYVLLDFKTIKTRRNAHNFKYSTKEILF